MPRARDPNRDIAFEIWKKHKGEITNRALAKELNVLEKTISAWKSRDKWNAVLQKNESSTANKKTKKNHGGQPGNRGNPSPSTSFPKHNRASLKHGFFSKYIPQESLDIMEEIQERSIVDMLWDQIMIQYSAIIRAQRIMFVTDQNDMTKEIKKQKSVLSEMQETMETEWEIQFAWDKHATFLNAQSRAISELRSSIKQFDEMAHIDDERRLKLEQMRLGIEKTKADIDKVNDDDKPIEIVIKRKGDK
ncbi:phage terminase small subunit [Metabacillus idriensis]|uniref:phage terminase small subunit n=1 Tax=Metabacillus idriensis TaxID=324768 RepID=UPI00203F4F9A|nr:phage terminase small subunit [Metabacillus idriensis]MCM3598695.1 phage terminase small subunit [Metabacillus idriensis]